MEHAAAQPGPAVELSDVTRVYRRNEGNVAALAGVSLSIAPGSITAVTGPSGCGKSSLLFVIGGLDKPTSGRVSVLGARLDELRDDQLADLRRRHIGFVFQNYHLIPTLTVCENVMLPLVPLRVNSLEARARALAYIERVGLQKRINHLPGELSGGEQQRTALARALVNRPEIILADEPTGNLDPDSAAVVLDLLLDLARGEGKTVVLTSHNREVAERCERVVRVVEGAVTESRASSPGG